MNIIDKNNLFKSILYQLVEDKRLLSSLEEQVKEDNYYDAFISFEPRIGKVMENFLSDIYLKKEEFLCYDEDDDEDIKAYIEILNNISNGEDLYLHTIVFSYIIFATYYDTMDPYEDNEIIAKLLINILPKEESEKFIKNNLQYENSTTHFGLQAISISDELIKEYFFIHYDDAFEQFVRISIRKDRLYYREEDQKEISKKNKND